jgi:hypothetical protein
MAELTISDHEPPAITGKVCLKSPARTTTFPPKGNLLVLADGKDNKSESILSRASKAILCHQSFIPYN